MIIGNGLISNLFRENDRENVVFFASGVSNSLETEKSAFLREENLLRNADFSVSSELETPLAKKTTFSLSFSLNKLAISPFPTII